MELSGKLLLLLFVIFGFLVDDSDAWWTSRRRRRRCSASNCALSGWSSWSACTQSCGSSGSQNRQRRVTRIQTCGGTCSHLSETRACNRRCCPVNCGWSWGNWGACGGCGRGTRSRSAVVSVSPSCGGTACPSTTTQSGSCDTGRCCPVNCVVTSWGLWGTCNARCEKTGTRTRTRTVTTASSCNGRPCPGLTQYNTCNGPCCARDCVLSQWTGWGACNAPAGQCGTNSGSQGRSRTVVTTQSCGGRCFPLQATQRCTPVPLQCQLSQWGGWSACTPRNGRCGGGTQARIRTITRRPYCAPACPATTQSRDCVHSCCPVNCVLSQWSSWGTCSANCGAGSQIRSRRVITPSSCGGTCSSTFSQTQACTVTQKIDCQLSSWSSWSICSSGCGNGLQQRARVITRQPTPCGTPCANLTDNKQCQSYRDNTDCQVGSWTSWGLCDAKCLVGSKSRSRSVTQRKRCNGAVCPSLTESTSCGLPNGGCEQQCQSSDGTCFCLPGYDIRNRTHCRRKDCGRAAINYCPSGAANGTVCRQPWVSCANGATVYGTTCTINCPTNYRLVGLATIKCETDGSWTAGYKSAYCRRTNDPPSNIILSGSQRIAENNTVGEIIGTLSSIDINSKDAHIYSLVNDASYQGKFSIMANELRAQVQFDYETGSKSFSVGITSTDNGSPPLSFTKHFTINIDDVNEPATDVRISSSTVAENSKLGTRIGTFDTVDVDTNQRNTYRLIDSANGLFRIRNDFLEVAKPIGNCLVTGSNNCPLNFELQRLHSIQVESYDDKTPSLSITRSFNISLIDSNDPPYDIRLSGNRVKENALKGAFIGRFSGKDEDRSPQQTLHFALTDDDNGRFSVSSTGNLIKRRDTDYETSQRHMIQVRVTDDGSPPASNVESFTVVVVDVNEPPVNITVNPLQPIISEDAAPRTAVCKIEVYEDDFVTGLNLTLDADAGGLFNISEHQNCENSSLAKTKCTAELLLNSQLNYENANSHGITVRAEDRGHFISRSFTINVKDANDAPVEVLVNGKKYEEIPENSPGAAIGALLAIDEDKNQSHTFSVAGNDVMGAIFEINGSMLKIADGVSLDYEAKNVYTLSINVTDNGVPEASTVSTIEVRVKNVNEAPTDVVLSKDIVDENSAAGTVVANVTVVDPDDVSYKRIKYHSCTLRDSAQGRFKIIDRLKLAVDSGGLNYEQQSNHSVTLQCSDGALTLLKTFTIALNDVNEMPSALILSNNKIDENIQSRHAIGYLSTMDPDNLVAIRQSFTYKVVGNDSRFEIKGNTLFSTTPFDFETNPVHSVVVSSTDNGDPALTKMQNMRIEVVDKNDAPIDLMISSDTVEENSAEDTVVGILATVDDDLGQSFTYRLADNADGRFRIEGNMVKVARSNADCLNLGGSYCNLNFEAENFHQVEIKTTDNGNPPLSFSKNVSIFLRDVNDMPRDVRLSNHMVNETAPVNFIIGKITASDEDKGQVLTYVLTNDDHGTFGVDSQGNLYKATNKTNFETKEKHLITVLITDNGYRPLKISKNFTIEILDVNEAPVKTVIRNDGGPFKFPENRPVVQENSKVGAVIGTVVSYDSDPVEHLVLSLDDNAGGAFSLERNVSCRNTTEMVGVRSVCVVRLILSKAVNYEKQSNYTIIVRSTDNHGLYYVQEFSLGISDGNDRPMAVMIGGLKFAVVLENQQGTLIDEMTTLDEDIGQNHVYSVIGNNTDMFAIYKSYLFLSARTVFDYEKETIHKVSVNTTDSGDPPLSFVDTLELRVQDVNEAPTNISLTGDSVFENSPVGTVIGNLTVEDPDNFGIGGTKQIHSCSISAGASGLLVVNGMQLAVARNGIDFEQASSMNISIRCEDSGHPILYVEKWIIIDVKDINEKPIDILLSTSSVAENTAPGGLAMLSTIDPDQASSSFYALQSFTYTISNSEDNAPFNISGNILSITRMLDYENQASWSLTIRSADNGVPSYFIEKTFVINVTDVNEQPNDILLANAYVDENSGRGIAVGNLSARDPDTGQSFSFSLVDDAGGLFMIEKHQIKVAQDNIECLDLGGVHCRINYETRRLINVQVKAEDDGSPALSFEKSIVINVRDINDSPRDIELSANNVTEDAPMGVRIGQFTATDEDGQEITFRLTHDDDGRFNLTDDGFIIKAKDTNYESSNAHKVTVEARDNGRPPLKISKDFYILIEDVNESPTHIELTSNGGQSIFPKDAAIVKENSPAGAVIGTLTAYDEDAVEGLTFSLDNDGSGAFSVDGTVSCSNTSANGTTSSTVCSTLLKVAGAVNYERASNMTLIVRVVDGKGLHHSHLFHVGVMDQNDRPTDVSLNGLDTGYVNENENSQLIANLESKDEDDSQSHSYRIINDHDALFTIRGRKLYTSSHASLNYEKRNQYTIVVESIDNGSPAMSFRKNLTVKVIDVNEAPTSLGLSNNVIDENSRADSTVGNISVADPDNEGAYNGRQKASCSVVVDASNIFGIKDDAKLYIKQSNLDYETKASYNLKIRCTDDGVPNKSVEKYITVNINDLNEPPSDITLTLSTVAENQGPVLLGRFITSDPDQRKQTFVLSLTENWLPFSIVGDTLKTKRSLNYEEKDNYRISVKAMDQGGLSIVENFTISVQDVNDPPSNILFTGSLSVEENSPAGVLVATASAVDEDFHQTHKYTIQSIIGFPHKASTVFMPLSGYFTIGSTSGRILSAVSSIDYEEYQAFNITVLTTDNGYPAMNIQKTVMIQVSDVNHPPTDLTFNGRLINENSPHGTVIGNFSIADPDNKFSQRQTYSCQATGNDSIPFKVSNKTSLTVIGEVDYEKKDFYILEVTCTEDVVNPFNITRTFSVNVVNVNEAPTGINVTSNTIAENLDPGSVVGKVFAVDPDNELTIVDNVTISLLSELDYAAFSLDSGNYLTTNQRFDYEQKNGFSIKIRAADNGRPVLSSTQILYIMVEDVNDQPTSISLSSNVVSENSSPGTVVGDLSTKDDDAGQTYTFSIINTVDNLVIHGRKLIVSGQLDYETEPLIALEINVTDSGNPVLSYQQSFNITVADGNDAPSDIAYTLNPVRENNTVEQVVANLRLVDEDRNQQIRSCLMISNPGYFVFNTDSINNVVHMLIKAIAPLDYETTPVINATIQCFDNGTPALSVKKSLRIRILDSNEAPTKILINGSAVVQLPENAPLEAVAGHLSCIDQDSSQSHVYTLESAKDVFMMSENSNVLRVRNSTQLDYEALPPAKRLPVQIRVEDNGNPALSYTGTIDIEVTDVNEAPSKVRLIHKVSEEIPENSTIGTHIGELFADNPEGFRQQLMFNVLNWKGTFGVTEGHGPGKVSYLTIRKELDYSITPSYNLTIQVTDSGVPPLSAQGTLTLNVKRTDPCASGVLDCGAEICQRVNKTKGNCGCLAGYEPKDGTCAQIDDCQANCLYCDDSKKACEVRRKCTPCDNNATCIDKLMGYKCNCLPGFSDERCKTNIDDCAAKPCRHGTCFDLVKNYRCECDEGYAGRNCSENIDECKSQPCVKGTCSDMIGGVYCKCDQEVWGLFCNRRKSDCPPDKCGKNVCVPPAYKDSASLSKGGLGVLCANSEQVITLSFSSSSVPDKVEQQSRWKHLFRRFITELVSIPFYSVDLSEEKSNGGFYAPTDVVFYPFKPSRTKREASSSATYIDLQLVVKVQHRFVPQDSFLRAVNKTCVTIQQSSAYWVFCGASHARIKELGITAESGKSAKKAESTSGFKILRGNNIYILIGGGAGLLLTLAVLLMVRARKKAVTHKAKMSAYRTDLMTEGIGNYYDAMERHLAERVDGPTGTVNPMYGEEEDEVRHCNKMFENPLYGASGMHESDDDENCAGVTNPMHCGHGQWSKDILPSAESVIHDNNFTPNGSPSNGGWAIEVVPKANSKNDSLC